MQFENLIVESSTANAGMRDLLCCKDDVIAAKTFGHERRLAWLNPPTVPPTLRRIFFVRDIGLLQGMQTKRATRQGTLVHSPSDRDPS